MTSIFIDPYLLACPTIEQGREEYEKFICTLLNWQELLSCDWADIFLSNRTSDILINLNKYPLWDDLKKANATFGIDYIAPDTVMKLVTSFLSKFRSIEDHLYLEAIDYSDLVIQPDIVCKRNDLQLSNILKDLLVFMVLKCRCYNDDPYEQILATEIDHESIIEISFSLVDILYKKEHFKYPISKPVNEKESFKFYKDYDETCSIKKFVLKETDLSINDKKIKLSGDHHGNNILHDFAKKLFNSPYITEVINNLPFNSFTKSFIHSVYDNGQIDIYLTKYDEGYGMTIQTTGANIIETTAIALPLESFKKLTHKYSTHKSTLHTCASYIGYYYLPCN